MALTDLKFPIAILKNWSHVDFIITDVRESSIVVTLIIRKTQIAAKGWSLQEGIIYEQALRNGICKVITNNFRKTDKIKTLRLLSLWKAVFHVKHILLQCYNQFNKPEDGKARSYPLCAAQVKNAMDAAKDTPTCIRRSNMVTNLNPREYSTTRVSYVAAIAP